MNKSGTMEPILRGSYVFNTGSITPVKRIGASPAHSHSFSHKEQLRRSRIQNLPNYRKTSLGDNSHFIIVFQAIQIERLTQQLQLLRVKLKVDERQLMTVQNHGVQIRQLTQKCFAQERDLSDFRQQYQKLNKICETLYHENQMLKNRLEDNDFSIKHKYEAEKVKNGELDLELDKWKLKFQAFEKGKERELEEQRAMIEQQCRSVIMRENRQLSVRFESERSGLENQIKKSRQQLQKRRIQIEDYKIRCQKYQMAVGELKRLQNIVSDNESRIAMTSQQLMRLHALLKDKEEQIQTLRVNQNKLTTQIKELKNSQIEAKQIKLTIQARFKQVQYWKKNAQGLQEDISRARELHHYNIQLKGKLQLLEKQIERVSTMLRAKLQETEQLKRAAIQKQLQLVHLNKLQNELNSYESKINVLKLQNERVQGVLKLRLQQIDQFKNKCNSLVQKLQSLQIVQNQRKMFEERWRQQVQMGQQAAQKLIQFNRKISEFQSVQTTLRQSQRTKQILTKEIQKMNTAYKAQSTQLIDARQRCSTIQNQLQNYESIQSHLNDYQSKIGLLTSQLQKLNELLKQRNGVITRMDRQKLQMHNKINYYKNYQIRLNENQQVVVKMQENIGTARKEVENWQIKYREAENRYRQIQASLVRTTEEKQKIGKLLKQKHLQYDQIRSQCALFESELKRKGDVQLLMQQQQAQIGKITNDIQDYQRNLQLYEQQLEKERNISTDFGFRVIVLSSQIQRLNSQTVVLSKAKTKQYLQLLERHNRLQERVKQKNAHIDELIVKITSLQSKLMQMISDCNRIFAQAQRSQTETVNLTRNIQEYQNYASRIHILVSEIDRLQSQNKNFDQDIRRLRLKYAENIKFEEKEQGLLLKLVLMSVQIEALRARIQKREMSQQELRQSILQPIRKIH